MQQPQPIPADLEALAQHFSNTSGAGRRYPLREETFNIMFSFVAHKFFGITDPGQTSELVRDAYAAHKEALPTSASFPERMKDYWHGAASLFGTPSAYVLEPETGFFSVARDVVMTMIDIHTYLDKKGYTRVTYKPR